MLDTAVVIPPELENTRLKEKEKERKGVDEIQKMRMAALVTDDNDGSAPVADGGSGNRNGNGDGDGNAKGRLPVLTASINKRDSLRGPTETHTHPHPHPQHKEPSDKKAREVVSSEAKRLAKMTTRQRIEAYMDRGISWYRIRSVEHRERHKQQGVGMEER